MVYVVYLSQSSEKFLNKLDKHIGDRIKEKLKNLGSNPHPSDAKFIVREKEDKIFRYRIGDYRALYKVKENDKVVLIAKIDKRSKVYNK